MSTTTSDVPASGVTHQQTNRTVTLYDTTLRDGSQAESVNFSLNEKLRIARRLDDFGMHYIEGGWPGSNTKDAEFFATLKSEGFRFAKLAAFGSTRRADTDVATDKQVAALVESEAPVITLVGKSWIMQVTEILRTTGEENLAMIEDTVRYLTGLGREVIFDAEHFFDGYKEDAAYAINCLQAAERGGASFVVLCDTNGGSLPSEVARITADALAKVGCQVGIHTHDDSGLGVANALAAVDAGATQVQGVTNGFGERTGNCNLTTVIPNLQLKMGRAVVTDEKLAQLRDLSLFVDEVANLRPNPRAPFVGASAFAHKGGLHANAVNKLARSYEHIRPELVGNSQRVLVGELSGGANIMLKARQLGLELDEKSPETRRVLASIKELEANGWEFEGADASFELLIRRLLDDGDWRTSLFFELDEYYVSIRKNRALSFDQIEATIKLTVEGRQQHRVAEGDGPVNALDAVMRKALLLSYPCLQDIRLTDYKVRILDSKEGTAARTRVMIESSDGETTWVTVGVSDDIIEASWRALRDSFEYKLLKSGEVSKKMAAIAPGEVGI